MKNICQRLPDFLKIATVHCIDSFFKFTRVSVWDAHLILGFQTGWGWEEGKGGHRNLLICVSLAKDCFMLHKKSNEDLATYNFFKQKNDSCEKEKFVYFLIYLKNFKAVYKNNPRTHSLQQNKKTVLTKVTYFKVSTPIRSHRTEIV